MAKNTMSFKAIINNIAKENKVASQAVLQTYMLERLLERISLSQYKNNFILKGGMLISAMLGIDSRTTMDMDTTIKGFPLTEENINKIMKEICEIKIEDNVTFKINNTALIRKDDDYGGFRITFEANYNNEMPVVLKIDVTTGDKITYKEIEYEFSLMLEDRKIRVLSYNLETVIAEKFESIIKRGPLTTRIRDYYDIYMLTNTQSKNIEEKELKDAIKETSKYRDSVKNIECWQETMDLIRENENLLKQWKKYQKNNIYATDIEYEDLIEAIEKIGNILEK